MSGVLRVRPLTADDLDWVCAAESVLHAFPWTRGNFCDSLEAGHACCVLERDGEPLGYAICLKIVDEAHLLNISVMRAVQGQGLGRWFLDVLGHGLWEHGARQMFLEVRPSNVAALRLYERAGFAPIGRRRDYYPAADGRREDAIVMRRELTSGA
ncbi:ribosomal protein S18-alanine N-acetyltransferase [Niveibacterium sp. COAC-50]|uniref:ribosomal protein S18-alanine N-acetyltransferase n=1 Tax=Niveibacterium sp. COAC-50 TaxID=2729384 RepID=UPI001553A2D5|nr:ribosomal protein S18-alanine N-acetyltransferase [Niveibacterium sp. COAC-50]